MSRKQKTLFILFYPLTKIKMRKSHKGHKKSLASSLAAGAALLALVLSPVSAAYLFQASVIGQDFGGGSGGGMQQQGPSFGGPMGGQNFKGEITKAEKALDLLSKLTYDSTKCTAVKESSALYDEVSSELSELKDSFEFLDPQDDATEVKELTSKMAALKKELSAAKKDKTKAASKCKKEVKKADKVLKALRSLPLSDIDGAMEAMADFQACSSLTRPQPMGGFNGPQGPMGGDMNDSDGDCANLGASLQATADGLSAFVQERNDSAAEEETMKEQFKQERESNSKMNQEFNKNTITNPQTMPTTGDFSKFGTTNTQTMPRNDKQGFMPRTGITNPQTKTNDMNNQGFMPQSGSNFMPQQGGQMTPPPAGGNMPPPPAGNMPPPPMN